MYNNCYSLARVWAACECPSKSTFLAQGNLIKILLEFKLVLLSPCINF